MNLKKLTFFFGLLLGFLFSRSQAIEYNGESQINFGTLLEVYSTQDETLTPQEVLQINNFKKGDADVLNLKTSNLTHWVKLEISNTTAQNAHFIIPFPVIDELDVYSINNGNPKELYKMGIAQPFTNRPVNYQDFVIPLPPNETSKMLLRLKNGSQLMLPTIVESTKNSFDRFLLKDHLMGIYGGIIAIMFFYNLFIYGSTRDKNYLFYLIYIFTVGFAQFTLNGFAYKYLFPNSPTLATSSIYVGGIISGLGVLLFVMQFLHVKKNLKWYYYFLLTYLVLYMVAGILLFTGQTQLSYHTINFCAFTGSLVVLLGASVIAFRGYRPARFFVVAWGVFLLSIIFFVLKDFGVVPYNEFTTYSMPIGSAIEVVVLALALADKINILQNENKLAREKELSLLKENEKLIKEQNVVLERKVAERTFDLQIAKDNLEETLNTLKNAQSQLVSQEKMASLGQLTAGIAHEINNPINFVSSNVGPLRRDIEDLKEIIDKYDDVTSPEECIEIRNEVEKLKKELDYNYILVEIDQLLTGIQDGAERTSEIVKSLKNFSRLDEIEAKFADIHEGIDSTLVILKSGTKKDVAIKTNYDDSIQPLECYPGKLNQVFSNLIVNAIQALTEEEKPVADPQIAITTKNLGDKVSVSIKDNGPGIPDEVKEKIFEPFFTTKDVGEGTGLGLSIVFSIIESHHGNIEVNSAVGEGTEFLITLPKTLH